ncbi:MAG: FAD-dependent oxidoreductase [Bacillota bacterium]|nr:FAD-dependent oxidoreductase [Bacillota bacterium]
MSERQKIIIIGGGVAGLTAAQAARDTDPEARIHLICGEKRLPYFRPRICEIFSGADIEKLTVHNFQWFTERRIEVMYARVTMVNRADRQVKFQDGAFLNYDKLIIATGARGNLPEVEGSANENVTALRFYQDIGKIKSYTGPIVIIGDGLLGLEAAWHLSHDGRPVVIVGRSGRLLQRQLDKEAAVFFLKLVENAGIRVALNGELRRIEERQVVLEDGRAFEAAAVVFAAGIRPQIALAQALGLDCHRAIVVDQRMASSEPDIYACGDCCEYQGHTAGLWPASMAQGLVAGTNAAGGERLYTPEPPSYTMNAMGTRIWSYGQIEAASAAATRDMSKRQFTKLFFDEQERLCGAIVIGEPDLIMTLKKAVDTQLNRDEAKALLQ